MREFQPFYTTSADGTTIGGERTGAGPALVVVHGGMRAGSHYRALASALGARFSAAVFDRRGRGRSGPAREDDGIEVELADLQAVMAATGADIVFGHSAGALIGLEAALRFPLRRLVLYEPPVAIAAAISLDWVPAFRRSLDEDRPARALALLFDGLQLAPIRLPRWLVAFALRLAMRTEAGRELAALLRTMPRDLNTVLSLEGGCERYRAIQCPTLLLGGAKSPTYLRQATEDLTSSIPDAAGVELPGVGHNAPDEEGPTRVAAEIAMFCFDTRDSRNVVDT